MRQFLCMVVAAAAGILGVASVPASVSGEPPREAAPILPVPYRWVTLNGPFWGPRMLAVRTATLAVNREQCEATGRLANFDRAATKLRGSPSPGEYEGLLFNDSDVYKMMEGWAYVIAGEPDEARRAALDHELEEVIVRVAAAQHPDGYINTYYTLKAGIEKRFTREEWDHETYCMGHLIEAGVAHAQATGKRMLMDVAVKAADFLVGLYGPEKFTAPPGHQELELALVRLADATGEEKYAGLAKYLIEQRGRPHRKLDGTVYGPWGDYAQDHAPFREQFEAAGHAVRAGYFYAAATDLALRGEREYVPVLESLWRDITQRRIFVTGGIGPSGHNEGFTTPYDIPTRSAYQETCASIALCMWAERMFRLHGDGAYMDQFEQTLYNAVLAGVSTEGDRFFYVNPLASGGGHRRQEWFKCACCPPNVLRFLASLGGHVYAVKGDTAYVNLYAQGEATIGVGGLGKGRPVKVRQTTDHPFDGRVRIDLENTGAMGELALRIPGWARGAGVVGGGPKVTAGDASVSPVGEDGYVRVRPSGETLTVTIDFDMTPRRIHADPRVKATVGRVAIQRGPIIYAVEEEDNAGGVAGLIVSASARIEPAPGIGGDGVPAVIVEGQRVVAGGVEEADGAEARLYKIEGAVEPVRITMRPYFMWANRSPGAMAVWLPETSSVMDPAPMKGVRASASFVGNGDGVGAMIDRIEPASSGDLTVPRFTFWNHKGTEEWIAVEFDEPRALSRTAVYWFDDTGAGECRVPKAWRVEALVDGQWRPVVAASGQGGVEKNRFNEVSFERVRATGLRVLVMMQAEWSAGVLEWTWGR